MASLSKPPLLFHNHLTSSSYSLTAPSSLFFPKTTSFQYRRICAGRNEAEGGPELLRKPVVKEVEESDAEEEGKWVDWEDKILEDTVPLVGFVRMILHSGKYESGDRLSAEYQKTIVERLLAFHPEAAKKIGSGIDYITLF